MGQRGLPPPGSGYGPASANFAMTFTRSSCGEFVYAFHVISVAGDVAAASVTMPGTHEGGLPPGIPATHQPFSVKHVHLFSFADDGRIVEPTARREELGTLREL